jgi:hypothetical protein
VENEEKMVDTKYGHLVNKLSFKKGMMGGGNARELTFVGGDELGFDFNFIVGVYESIGDWAPNRGAHVHPFDEFLLFFGYDEKDMNYLGSEIDLALGKEQEEHRFNVPTVAIAPKGFPHCPLVTEKVYKPFGHFHLALAPKYAGERVEKEGTTDGNKYNNLVKKFQVRKGPGGANAVQTISMSGAELGGYNIHFAMGLYKQAGEWYPGKGAMVNPYDECLVFFGNKTSDASYLGAEITIELGKEHEKHSFNVPTVIVIPRGMPHFPIVCNKVEKPYRMMQIGLSPEYQGSRVG